MFNTRPRSKTPGCRTLLFARRHSIDEQVDERCAEVAIQRTTKNDGAGQCGAEEGVDDEPKIDIRADLAPVLGLFEQVAHSVVFRAEDPTLNEARELRAR